MKDYSTSYGATATVESFSETQKEGETYKIFVGDENPGSDHISSKIVEKSIEQIKHSGNRDWRLAIEDIEKKLEILEMLKPRIYIEEGLYREDFQDDRLKFGKDFFDSAEQENTIKEWLENKEINQSKIVNIDRDTAVYVLEKVQEAFQEVINTMYYKEERQLDIETRKVVECVKSPTEMFYTLNDKLQDILNEIKKIK